MPQGDAHCHADFVTLVWVTQAVLQDRRHASTAFDMFDDGPIVVQAIRAYATLDVEAAEQTLRLGRLVADGRRPPLLVDLRAPCSVDVAARSVLASAEMGEIFAAVALLTTNTLTRLAANLLLKVNRPPYPVRMFSDETTARGWLAEYSES